MTQAQDEAWLHKGWAWLDEREAGPPEGFEAIHEAYLAFLRRYEENYRLTHEPEPTTRVVLYGEEAQVPLDMPPGTQ